MINFSIAKCDLYITRKLFDVQSATYFENVSFKSLSEDNEISYSIFNLTLFSGITHV